MSSFIILSINNISLIAYDFDGVMTDYRVIIREDGLESVVVNRSDGLAIDIIKAQGIPQLIISREKNAIISKRGEKLGIPVMQDVINKKEALKRYCEELSIDLNNTLYIGNDLNDIEVMRSVGWPLCPEDAYPEVKKISKFIIPVRGGDGVVRALLNYIGIIMEGD
jgi:3-deoxy-D-manno-octulosonate 8-phosphate phosphatase (KDO 8-P phosphatase)